MTPKRDPRSDPEVRALIDTFERLSGQRFDPDPLYVEPVWPRLAFVLLGLLVGAVVVLLAATSRPAQEPSPHSGVGEPLALAGTPQVTASAVRYGVPPNPAVAHVAAHEGPTADVSMPGHTQTGARTQVPGGNPLTVRLGDSSVAAGEQVPGGNRAPAITIRGTATWYCGGGSPCTRGHSPSELIAAIDPTTGIPKGSQLTVWHGDASVVVEIVDVCQCPGERIVDLSRLAFSRLADPSRGIIRVVLVPARGSADAVPQMTLPPTDSLGGTP